MRKATKLTLNRIFWGLVFVLLGSLLVSPTGASAQSQGNNAVYYESSVSPYSAACCQGSGAFIDASMFISNASANNVCAILNYIMAPGHGFPATGAVIDARGLNSTNTSMNCLTGTTSWTPWNNGSANLNVPSTILLPAGTIVIPTAWVLPPSTHLIGVTAFFSSPGAGLRSGQRSRRATV
jgi:hypothetical protein